MAQPACISQQLECGSRKVSCRCFSVLLLAAALSGAVLGAHGASGNYTSDMLLKAINQPYEPGGSYADKPPAQYMEWLEEQPARLRAAKVWWSQKSNSSSSPVTVATVATSSRLYQLEAQCGSWSGPLSAAVYLPVPVPRNASKEAMDAAAKAARTDSERRLGQLHKWAEKNAGTGCYLDAVLLYEFVSDEPLMGLMFPVNSLRNFALTQARTPLVALIDVDLLVSHTLAAWMNSTNNAKVLLERCQGKTVVVLPAFETEEFPGSVEEKHVKTAHKVAAATVRSDKRTVLSAMVAQGLVHQFDKYSHNAGHYDTNYDRWFNATDMYAANLTKTTYEPWFIINRRHVPLYDVRFRGFGYNKQVHILALKKQGFQFLVHPEGFLVHRAHPRAPASHAYVQKEAAGSSSALRRNVTRYFGKHMDQVNSGTYQPCVDDALLNCHKTLPWAFPISNPKCIPYVLPEERDQPFVNFDEKPKMPPGPPAPPPHPVAAVPPPGNRSSNSSSNTNGTNSTANGSSSSIKSSSITATTNGSSSSSSNGSSSSSNSSSSSSSSSGGGRTPVASASLALPGTGSAKAQQRPHHQKTASWRKSKMMLRRL